MTNEVSARAIAVMGGFRGQLRKVHRAAWEDVAENGVSILFATAQEAELAAWRALKAHLCGDIVGSGEKISLAKAEQEFAKIFPGHGRRPVEVVRR